MTDLIATDNPLVQRLGWTLLHFLWQGALLGACIGLGLIVLRRGASTARYNLLLAGFGLMALTPVVTFLIVTPATPVAVVPTTSTEPVPEFTITQSTTTFAPPDVEPFLPFDQQVPPAEPSLPLADHPPAIREGAAQPATVATPVVERTLAQRVAPVLPWLVAGWLLGVFLLSLRLIGAWRRIQRLLRRDVCELETRWAEVGQRLLSIMQVRRAVRFLESRQAVVPVVIGWLKPVVVVPTSVLTNLTFEEAEALLAHELAHIRRWDEVVNLFQTVFETLFFYHPAVWFISARLRQEREHCCDDLAAEVVGDRLVYSRALVAAAQLAADRPHHLAVASTGGNLQQRIQRLMQGSPRQRIKTRWPVVTALSIIALLTLSIVACRPQADDTDVTVPVAAAGEADSVVVAEAPEEEALPEQPAEIPDSSAVDAAVAEAPESVTGTVLNPAGDPVEDALVYLLTDAQELTVFEVRDENRPRLEGEGPEQQATTAADGGFTFPNSEDWNRIAIVADQCPLWVIDRAELGRVDETIEIPLPETGKISAIVDLPEEGETVELDIRLVSFDDRVWRRDRYRDRYEVANPAETIIDGLPPGIYLVKRVDYTDFGTHKLLHGCEPQIVSVSAEQAGEVSFSRQFGVPVSGVVRGLDRDDFGHACLAIQYLGPEEELRPDGRRSRTLTYFDGIRLDRDGTFTTTPMPPGEYSFYVGAFLGDRRDGSPDLRRAVVVNVPATGEVRDVVIEVSPNGQLDFPRAPDDPDRITAGLEDGEDSEPTEEATADEHSDFAPQQLIAGIERAMQQFLSVEYSAEYEEVRDANAFREGEEPLNFTGTGQYTYRSDGRRWFADEQGFTHTIGSTDVRPTRKLSGFDGTVHYSREGDIVTLGVDSLAVERRAPHKVFWEIGKNWSWLKSALESPSAEVKERPVINGHECVSIHSETTRPGRELAFQYEIVISPKQSHLPISCVIRRNGELETTWAMEGLAQTDDGLWYPGAIVTGHAHPSPTKSMRLTITSLELRDDFTDDDFSYPVPAGVDVVDYPGSIVYFNDPWWPELRTLLNERFDRPTPWLMPTDEMSSYADGTIDGQPAPAIEAGEWINGNPGNWDRPDRDYTVLFFFGGRPISPTPKWLAGLKALQQKYGEGGLELMGVVTPEAADGAKQTAREFRLTFPIAVAAESEQRGSYGKPHDAFGLQSYAGVFVIDPDGIVHTVNPQQSDGETSRQLEPLIQQLMDLPVEEFARPEDGLSRAQWDALVTEWRSLRDSAPANARMSGRVTASRRGPVAVDFAAVDLTLTPALNMVSGHTPYGHTQQFDDGQSVTIACDDDGRYEFLDLAKGTYRLTVIGPGIEKLQRLVAIAGNDSDVTLDVAVASPRAE